MEQKNKLLTIALFGFVLLAVAPFTSALAISSTWNSPANYTNYTGSFSWNCTTAGDVNVTVLNVTIYANSSTGVMTSLGTTTNTSAIQTAWTGTATITSALDGTNYNLSCYVDNGTNQAYSNEAGATHIMFDSTDPVCNVSVEHNTIAYKGNQKIIYYSSDVIERVTTSLTIDGPGSQTTITATGANGPIELGSNDTKYYGSWALALTVTDRAGNTCTDSITFKSYLPDGKEDVVPTDDSKTKGIVVISIIALIAYFAFIKKK